jgi:hypothetical protein
MAPLVFEHTFSVLNEDQLLDVGQALQLSWMEEIRSHEVLLFLCDEAVRGPLGFDPSFCDASHHSLLALARSRLPQHEKIASIKSLISLGISAPQKGTPAWKALPVQLCVSCHARSALFL